MKHDSIITILVKQAKVEDEDEAHSICQEQTDIQTEIATP